MADTSIEWTDTVWNPVTGCSKVSTGCKNCYAETVAMRFWKTQYPPVQQSYSEKGGPVMRHRDFTDVMCHEDRLDQPLRWKRGRRIFVNSMSDLFHEDVPFEFIDRVFAVMALAPQHTFQILTKRASRMREYLNSRTENTFGALGAPTAAIYQSAYTVTEDNNAGRRIAEGPWPLPNVWLGVSVEDQPRADERVQHLLQTPAAVRFISIEPLLGPVDVSSYVSFLSRPIWSETRMVDWVIVGGESGPNARPMHPEWARSIRDQCQASGVPFFFKQWGEWTPGVNVERRTGTVGTADWFDGRWMFGDENLARTDGHIDDEPDLYRVGKKAAGRLLDGREWDDMPAVRP